MSEDADYIAKWRADFDESMRVAQYALAVMNEGRINPVEAIAQDTILLHSMGIKVEVDMWQ